LTPALKQGDLVEVHGWVMLNKIEPGIYKIKTVEDRNGLPAYTFARPGGRKGIITHYAGSVDGWLGAADSPNLNKIVRVDGYRRPPRRLCAGDPCPTAGCDQRLRIASPSGGYLQCRNDHLHATRIKCDVPGCRRLATSFQCYVGRGRRATCAEHDSWPFF
jgi:hypothetical protein